MVEVPYGSVQDDSFTFFVLPCLLSIIYLGVSQFYN